jgi:hypothetical protein
MIRLFAAAIVAAAVPFAAAAGDTTACVSLATQLVHVPTGPVFLASYPGTTIRELKDAAFLYDNAVAAIALIACRDVAQARRIGDAILLAQDHDRYWHDGRLRNAFLAGAPANPVKLGGWWDPAQNQWVEDRYQVGSDSGNMAWAMLVLLALEGATHEPRYRAGAVRLGQWLERWRDTRGPGGFTGGAFGHEPKPDALTWKSTEHNTDLAAAFRALARSTSDKRWRIDANAAEAMVHALWRVDCNCFAVGTGEDGATPNRFVALDAQVWPLLALGDAETYHGALETMRARLRRSGGYAYSEAREGLWTEGTAQAALLLSLLHRDAEAAALGRVVVTMRAPDGTYYAASRAPLPTGFKLDTDPTKPRQYFHIPALAPLAWAALAVQRFNPFTGSRGR